MPPPTIEAGESREVTLGARNGHRDIFRKAYFARPSIPNFESRLGRIGCFAAETNFPQQ